jgi:hypothetical protein
MDYKIVKICGCPKTDNLEMELEDEVNMYIDMGWKPFGSICVINVGTPKDCEDDYFIEVWQPMIKEDDNE